MRAHAAPDDGGGHPERRTADARPAQNGSGLPGHRPADADVADDGNALPEDRRGHAEDRTADATPAVSGSGLPGHRPADADVADDGNALPEDRPTDAAAVPAQPVNPLQRLIAGRLQERGWSYGEVARRSGLPRSTVYTLATTRNLVRPPRPATINGLAKGLGVPPSP